MRLAILFLLISFPHLITGQEVFADLDGIDIRGKRIAFDEIIEFEADCREVDLSWPLPSPLANGRLDCLVLRGSKLPHTTIISIYAFGKKSEELELNQKYRIAGRLSDAFTFGGRTNLHVDVTSVTALGEIPPQKEFEKELLVDLTKEIGEQVELRGKLLSLNGVWWFEQGDQRVILANERGRSRKFETNWHWQQVTVSGKLKRQLRASLDQHRAELPC